MDENKKTNYRELIEKTLPEGHTLTKNDISLLHTAIKDAIGKETVPREDYAVKVTRISELETEIRDMSGQATDGKTYKDLYETAKSDKERIEGEFAAFKSNIDTEKTNTAKKTALREALKAAGANPDDLILEALESKVDLAALEIDGDKLKDPDGVVKPLQEGYGKYFGTIQQRGAEVANPPANNGGTPNPWKKGEHYSLEEQTKLYREDPAKARQLAAAAGVKL